LFVANRPVSTLILGASHKPHRFAYKAMQKLQSIGITPVLVGPLPGIIEGLAVMTLEQAQAQLEAESKSGHGIDTIALYINPDKLTVLAEQVIALQPRRIIFNPGTESRELQALFSEAGISCVEDCVLRMIDGARY
jgi:predicted CoA-binding protein